MNSYERRIIHNALSNHKKVYTESEGEEPNRYIVIKPKEEEQKIMKNKKEERKLFLFFEKYAKVQHEKEEVQRIERRDKKNQ